MDAFHVVIAIVVALLSFLWRTTRSLRQRQPKTPLQPEVDRPAFAPESNVRKHLENDFTTAVQEQLSVDADEQQKIGRAAAEESVLRREQQELESWRSDFTVDGSGLLTTRRDSLTQLIAARLPSDTVVMIDAIAQHTLLGVDDVASALNELQRCYSDGAILVDDRGAVAHVSLRSLRQTTSQIDRTGRISLRELGHS